MSDAERRAYVVGLGANLGDRRETLRSALSTLGSCGVIVAVSDLYETGAVGPPQPDYLNAAVLLESVLTPRGLLGGLLAVERAHGRVRLERWGPRTLDLDLLHSPDLVVMEPDLTLPHPELARRPFALLPLLDVLPDARDAQSGALYSDIVRALPTGDVRRLEARNSWYPGRAE